MTSQINALDAGVYQNIQTAFSAQTGANQIQDIIDLKLDKRRKVHFQCHSVCKTQCSRVCSEDLDVIERTHRLCICIGKSA